MMITTVLHLFCCLLILLCNLYMLHLTVLILLWKLFLMHIFPFVKGIKARHAEIHLIGIFSIPSFSELTRKLRSTGSRALMLFCCFSRLYNVSIPPEFHCLFWVVIFISTFCCFSAVSWTVWKLLSSFWGSSTYSTTNCKMVGRFS